MNTEQKNAALAGELRYFRSLKMPDVMDDQQATVYRFIGWAIAALLGDKTPTDGDSDRRVSPEKLRKVADDMSRFFVTGEQESRQYVQHMIRQAADVLEGNKPPAQMMVKDLAGVSWYITENWKDTSKRGRILTHLDMAIRLIREEAKLDPPAEVPAKVSEANPPADGKTVIVFREVLLIEETDFKDRVMTPIGSKILDVSAEKGVVSGNTRYFLHIQTPEVEQNWDWIDIKLLTRSTAAYLPPTAQFLKRIDMPEESSTYIYQL